MLNKTDTIVERLRTLGLGRDQARLYIELLKGPSTHLRLAQATGINRTKVYRIASDLEKRSLVTHRTDDRGTFLVATDPGTLEVEIVNQEEKVKAQRSALDQLLPVLGGIRGDKEGSDFIVHTYEGAEGFKQMLWHELKTKDEMLIFGSGTIEDAVPNRRWAEKLRALTVEAGYTIRELLNPGDKDQPFTLNDAFMTRYRYRNIPADVLLMKNQIVVYNDTVAIYHWREEQKVGVEVINKNYAHLMRQVFESYWRSAA